jgi:isopenicillin N synthase-like dioxygenase
MLPGLFALPSEKKEAVAMVKSPAFVGYTKLGAETTAGATDMREVCVTSQTSQTHADFRSNSTLELWMKRSGRRDNPSGVGWRDRVK